MCPEEHVLWRSPEQAVTASFTSYTEVGRRWAEGLILDTTRAAPIVTVIEDTACAIQTPLERLNK